MNPVECPKIKNSLHSQCDGTRNFRQSGYSHPTKAGAKAKEMKRQSKKIQEQAINIKENGRLLFALSRCEQVLKKI